jgi:hypothetical protein
VALDLLPKVDLVISAYFHSYCFNFVDYSPQHLALILLEDLPFEQLLHICVKFEVDEGVLGHIRDEIGGVSVGKVKFGQLWVDELVMISQVNEEGRYCPMEQVSRLQDSGVQHL